MGKSYYLKTFGCTYNQSDSERIERILIGAGYSSSNIYEDADIIIKNTCAVKKATESKIFSYISRIAQSKRANKIIITGCLPQIDKKIKSKIIDIIGDKGEIIHPRELAHIQNLLNNENTHNNLLDLWPSKVELFPLPIS